MDAVILFNQRRTRGKSFSFHPWIGGLQRLIWVTAFVGPIALRISSDALIVAPQSTKDRSQCGLSIEP
jgi:hypothetical protein